jgi:hypothetical protein
MATAPRKGVAPDLEAGLPSPSSSLKSESPKPAKPVTPPADPLFKENTVYGLTGKGGRKHRTRKHKKQARKTKKHLRRK